MFRHHLHSVEFSISSDDDPRNKLLFSISFDWLPSFQEGAGATVAHGWVTPVVGKKVRTNKRRKIAGIAYLHPNHCYEFNTLTGMRKSLDHLIENFIGKDKVNRKNREKIWNAFHDEIENERYK